MIIAFGGIYGALGMPPFEFFNITSDLDANKIYIRDLYQSWYHRGIPRIAKNIDDIAKYIMQELKRYLQKQLIVCGNSMGGYAAMLFGFLLNADIVHAFSPQTFISKGKRTFYGDNRWKKEIEVTYEAMNASPAYFDIKEPLSGKAVKTEFHIYYSCMDRLDKIHAERMKDNPRIILHPYKDLGHGVVRHLKETGQLREILLSSLHSDYQHKNKYPSALFEKEGNTKNERKRA